MLLHMHDLFGDVAQIGTYNIWLGDQPVKGHAGTCNKGGGAPSMQRARYIPCMAGYKPDIGRCHA